MNRSGPGHRPDNSRSIAAKSSAPNGMSTLISSAPRCTIDHDAEDTGICVIRRPVRTSPTMMERVTSAPHRRLERLDTATEVREDHSQPLESVEAARDDAEASLDLCHRGLV